MTNHNGQSQPSGTNPSGWSAPGGFFDWIRGISMRRTDDRWIAGVCGGVAERTGLDPMLVRGIAIVVTLLGGPIFLAYAVGWALLPDTTGRIHFQRMLQGIFDPALIAIGVLLVLTFMPFSQGLWWQGTPGWWGMPGWLEGMLRTGWIIVLVAGVIWLIVAIARKAPRPDPADPNGPRSHTDYWGAGQAPAPGSEQAASFVADASAAAPGEPAPQSESSSPTGEATATPSAPYPPSGPYAANSTYSPGYAWPQSPAVDHHAATQQRQAEARAQHEARMREQARRRAENAARWRARQPGAGYIAISLGLAVVGGALAALAARGFGWPQSALVFGVSGALAVLAIATIIAGIRGRENGGLGFFSTVAVIALVFVGIIPHGAQLSAFGTTTWSVTQLDSSQSQSYIAGFGTATIDLRGIEQTAEGGEVDLWLGLGTAEVIVPDDVPIEVRFSGAAATIDATGETDIDGTDRGLFPSAVVQNEAAESAAESEITTVHVRVLFGTADVTVRSAP